MVLPIVSLTGAWWGMQSSFSSALCISTSISCGVSASFDGGKRACRFGMSVGGQVGAGSGVADFGCGGNGGSAFGC